MFFHNSLSLRFCIVPFLRNCSHQLPAYRLLSSGKVWDFKNTYQAQILEKFRTDDRYVSFPKDVTSDMSPLEMDFNGCPTKDYLKYLVSNKKDVIKKSRVKGVLGNISSRVQSSNLEDILMIFDASLAIFGSKFVNSEIHFRGLSRISDLLISNVYSNQLYLQSLFYASLIKQSTSYHNLIKRILLILTPQIRKFSFEELGIFCNSLFRSSVQLNESCCCFLINSLKENLKGYLGNSYVFTSVIKCLRFAECYNKELFLLLSQNIESLQTISLLAKIHLLVYVSDQNYADVDFVRSLMKIIMEDELIDTVRLKDVDNILWALSNYSISDSYEAFNLNRLEKCIEEEINLSTRDASTVFACLLSLWVLNGPRDSDIYKFITKENVGVVKRTKNFKHMAQVSLLLTCASIEAPDLLEAGIIEERDLRPTPKIDKYLRNRPHLKRLHDLIANNSNSLKMGGLMYSFIVPGLYICGLKATFESSPVYIELLDETVCLHDSNIPRGQMMLKLRLMQRLKLKTFVVKDVNVFNNHKVLMNDLKLFLNVS